MAAWGVMGGDGCRVVASRTFLMHSEDLALTLGEKAIPAPPVGHIFLNFSAPRPPPKLIFWYVVGYISMYLVYKGELAIPPIS